MKEMETVLHQAGGISLEGFRGVCRFTQQFPIIRFGELRHVPKSKEEREI